MVNIAYLFSLIYCIGFFIVNFSYNVSAIGPSITDAAFSESAIEDVQGRPRQAIALLVPLEDDGSGEERHKSKRCWRARPLRKMRLSCNPKGFYRTNAESTGRFRYNRKNLVGSNRMMKEEQLPHAESYVKIFHDLYGDEKRSAEESEESLNSSENSGDNTGGKIPLLRLAPVKNPKKNLKGLFRTEKKSQDDTSSNEYDENNEDLILKKIKNHLDSNDYNVLALVGKRADHSVTDNDKSKKYFCYCSEPNCPRSNCQRITYRPCLSRKTLKPIFVGGANDYRSNNEETRTVDERIPVNIQYPVPKNHYNEYSMDNNVQSENNQRTSISKQLQPDAISELDYSNSQDNKPAFTDGRSHEFYYGSPRRTVNVNRYDNIEPNRNQYRIPTASGPGVSSGLSNQYLISQPKPAIGTIYPIIPAQINSNNHQLPYSQRPVKSYNPLISRKTGDQISSYNNQIIMQDSFKARDTHTGFVDSTMPTSSQGIIDSFQQVGPPCSQISQTLGSMQSKAANLHPISNNAYNNKFVENSYHSGNGFAWNLPNGMRSQLYYPQQQNHQDSFARLTPGFEHTMNHQEAPESSLNLGKDSTPLEKPVELDEEKRQSLETDEEMDNRFDFEDARIELSTESNLGVKEDAKMIDDNENRSDESADHNLGDASHENYFEGGNKDSQMTIDDSKSLEAAKTTRPLISHENLAHTEYPQDVDRVGDSVKISPSYEDVSDEDQGYRHPSMSSKTIHHSSSDEFRDTSSRYELIGSKNKVGEKDAQYSIQDDNKFHPIDETALKTQIERPMEVKPAWNRYSDLEGLSDPVSRPENNYRISLNRHPMIDYDQVYNRPRFDQYPNFISHTNENDGLFHHFPAQGIPESTWNAELTKAQPNYFGIKKSDRVLINSSGGSRRPAVWKDNDYFDRHEERNGYFTSQIHDSVREMSNKNIGAKETESTPSTHFSESVTKSSNDADTRYDPKQYEGNGYTSDYEDQSFDMSHEIESSKESDSEGNNFSVTTDEMQSKYDDSDVESSRMQGHGVLDNSDAVFTESRKENTEDESKIIHKTDFESSREKIVGEMQPVEIQKQNENIPRELESKDASAKLDSQRTSEALITTEKSSSEVLGEKLGESAHEQRTNESKDDYKSHSIMGEQASESNERMVEEYYDEHTHEKDEPLFPVDILKKESPTAAEGKVSKAIPVHVDGDGDEAEKDLEGSIDSYEGDNSHSEEYHHSVYSTEKNPTVSRDENSEKVGAAKTEHVLREDKISSCPVFNGREIPIENSPTKYFSPNDRRLEYIKKHSSNLLGSKYSTATERDEQNVDPVIYHTQRSESGSHSDEMNTKLSQSEDDWYDNRAEISNRNYEHETMKSGTSHEFSKEDYSNKNKLKSNGEHNGFIHLTKNREKNFKTFQHYKDYDDLASNSESGASESDELHGKTDNYEMTVSSILEHRKNSADDKLTQNYEGTTDNEFIGDIQTPLKPDEATRRKDATEYSPTDVLGGIYHRDNVEDEELLTSIDHQETLDSTESPELKYDDTFSGIKDFKKHGESAEVVEVPKKSISETYDHSLTGSIERSVNAGNSKGFGTSSNYNEEGITHLQKELSPHDYEDSAAAEDLEPSKESDKSKTDHLTENSSVSKYTSTLHNDKGKAEPILGTTSMCGCSAVGRKVTTDGDQNGKIMSKNDFLTSSRHADGVEMVTIKNRENYNSEEEIASSIETEERQSHEVFNRESSAMNTDEDLSPEFDQKVHDGNTVDSDRYVRVENPTTQSKTGSLSSDVKVDQDEEFSQYSSKSEENQYSTLSHSSESGKHAGIGENPSRGGEKTSLEDGREDFKNGKNYHIKQGTHSLENSYYGSHDNTREKSSSSFQVEKNHESVKSSSEVRNAEFIGSAQSLHQGSCTKPPEVQNDIGYLGRFAPKNLNAEVKTLGDLVGSDLYYIGDGVRLPLTIKQLKDGSFALSISDKICEQRIVEKCPCCVPREGRILQEKRSEFNAAKPLEKIDSQGISADRKPKTNEELVDMSQALNHGELQLERNERDLNVDEELRHRKRATRSITMPVVDFIEKYNLNLNLDDVQQRKENLGDSTGIESRSKHNVIQRDEAKNDPEEQNSSLVHEFASIDEVPQNITANALLTTLENLIGTKPGDINAVIHEIKDELSNVKEGRKSEGDGSEKKTSGVQSDRYSYQRGNLILDRIAVLQKLQNKEYKCERRYQKDCDDVITEKTKLLTMILYWLKDLVTHQQN